MSRKALSSKTSELSINADIKRPKWPLTGTRKGKQKRDNIENAQSTTSPALSLANLPIQKQSTKVRKRLLTEHQTNGSLDIIDISDQHPAKRHRLQGDARTKSGQLNVPPSTHNVPTLHRTLSENSPYLNQTSHSKEPALIKSQPTLTRTKKRSKPNRATAGFESDDADDEDELPHKESTNDSPWSTAPITDKSNPERIKAGPRLGVIDATNKPQSPVKNQLHSSYEDELFGSDTTLTCPEDDSENDDLDVAQSAKPGETPSSTPSVTSDIPSNKGDDPTLSTLAPIPVVRRRPGRPRKVPLPDMKEGVRPSRSDCPKEDHAGTMPSSTSVTKQLRLKSLWEQKALAMSKPAPETSRSSKTQGSLMARVLDGAKQPLHLDSDPDEVNAAADIAAESLSELTESLEMLQKAAKHDLDKKCAPLEQLDSVVNPTCLAAVTPEFVNVVLAVNTLEVAATVEGSMTPVIACPALPKNHVSTLPARPAEHDDKPCASPLPSSSEPLTPSKSLIEKLEPPRHYPPRSLAPQASLEIKTQQHLARHISDVHALKARLQHTLQKAICKVQGSDLESLKPTTPCEEPSAMSSSNESQVTGIDNGNSHSHSSSRKQARKQTLLAGIAARRKIVADAYSAMGLPSPPESWDKSSAILLEGLDSGSDIVSDANYNSNASRCLKMRGNPVSQLSSRLGCDYCGRTYKTKGGLVYHMNRCTMAQLQNSIASDTDDVSTASETEDQRKARCPMASNELVNAKNSDSSDEYEHEDEDAIIRCVCGCSDDEGGMVQCDKCTSWLHLDCLSLTEADIPEEYYCPSCQGMPIPITRGKSLRQAPNRLKQSLKTRMPNRLSLRSASEDSEKEDGDHSPETRQGDGVVTDQHHSPQVVLSYDEPTSTIFKDKHSPSLMLDGSFSQEGRADLTNHMHSSLQLQSEVDLSFQDSQIFDYVPSTDPLFEPENMMNDLLISENSIDSEGLQTPIDFTLDIRPSGMWAEPGLEKFVEETAEGFSLDIDRAVKDLRVSDQFPVLANDYVAGWYCDEPPSVAEGFDLEGLIDLDVVG
ncbi:hypothetical protein BGX28_003993 [Mortierella sp. GBA30]|nr:hypothetical protein BGX28_003993 [Mortierella sp. GBA30]